MMSDTLFTVIALAGLVLLLTGMVVVFTRRTPWLTPVRDPRIGELIAEVKAVRERVEVLADVQTRMLHRLEAAEARRSGEPGGEP
jgi:hypothetical protein